MSKLVWEKHPCKLLLYLEWVLLGIALLTVITLFLPHHSFRGALHHKESRLLFGFVALLSIIILGIIGYKIPKGFPLFNQLYIGFCLGLSWLIVLLIGKSDRVLPPLLLIVVIRGCLLFFGKARILIAILAYGSFIAIKIMSWRQISPLGIPLGRPLPMRFLRHLSESEIQGIFWGLLLNSALLFGLVLVFVMLLVGAILAEYESKQKLMLANRRLRQYALKIENQAILEERNRIAREIHDSVGHCLTAQSIQLENVACFFNKNPVKAEEHLIKARQLGKEALQNVRQSVATLRQKKLQNISLKASLKQLIQDFQTTTDIKVNLDIGYVLDISGDITTAIYHLVQEALTNVAKHSQANQVEIYLKEEDPKLLLIIKDNGIGFEPQANTTGFGLQGMRERVEALDGNFKLISQPGAGCKIIVEIQLIR